MLVKQSIQILMSHAELSSQLTNRILVQLVCMGFVIKDAAALKSIDFKIGMKC